MKEAMDATMVFLIGMGCFSVFCMIILATTLLQDVYRINKERK